MYENKSSPVTRDIDVCTHMRLSILLITGFVSCETSFKIIVLPLRH